MKWLVRTGGVCFAIFLIIACPGCGQIKHPPSNTQVAEYAKQDGPTAGTDTTVIARLFSHHGYANESTKSENWRRYWALTTFEVISVERGKWKEADVRYITEYTAPTPESGILIDEVPSYHLPPHYPAAVWAFHLDTMTQPATLISFEERSLVLPHDQRPVPLDREPPDPLNPNRTPIVSREKIYPPVKNYMATLGMKRSEDYHWGRAEQTDTAYVVQAVSSTKVKGRRAVWTLQIDKDTGQVSLLWSVP